MKAFIPREYWDYKDVFLKTNFNELPKHLDFDRAINLKDSFTAVCTFNGSRARF